MALGKRVKVTQEKPVYPEPNRLPESHREWYGRVTATVRTMEPAPCLSQRQIVEGLDADLYNPFWALGKLNPERQPTDLTQLTLERFQAWWWETLRVRGLTEESIDAICSDMAEQDRQIAEWEKNGRPPVAKVLGVDCVPEGSGGGK
jgi:hypothetical protein